MITILIIALLVIVILSLFGATPRLGPGNVSEALLVILLVLLIIWLAGGLGEGRLI